MTILMDRPRFLSFFFFFCYVMRNLRNVASYLLIRSLRFPAGKLLRYRYTAVITIINNINYRYNYRQILIFASYSVIYTWWTHNVRVNHFISRLWQLSILKCSLHSEWHTLLLLYIYITNVIYLYSNKLYL